jgi:dipeptidyl aminopeptidase/acylaminoacyl peptidase
VRRTAGNLRSTGAVISRVNVARSLVALVLVLVACEPAPVPHAPQTPTLTPSGDSDRSFLGGGRILFLRSTGPLYAWRSIGLLTPDGTLRTYPKRSRAFPYWDPGSRDLILMLPYGEPLVARSLRIVGDRLVPVDAWRTEELPLPSLDGTMLAFTPIDRSGRPRYGALRLIERSTGRRSTVHGRRLVPLGWTPDGALLAVPVKGGRLVRWDPRTGATLRFGSAAGPGYDSVVWDRSGHRFAANAIASHGGRSSIVVGDLDGRVTTIAWVGTGIVETPTWSPDGSRIAFIVRPPGRQGHRRSRLHVFDLTLGIDAVVADRVSDTFWASWSPDGAWLLVDDWTRDRWLFVGADGDRIVPYPWLGSSPRWCCPSSPPISVPIPVS